VLEFVDDAIWLLQPASPTTDKIAVSTTGSGPTRGIGDCARWSRNLGKVVYSVSDTDDLYTLTPPAGDPRVGTWTWAQITTTGSISTPSGNGTYGKFHLLEAGPLTIGLLVNNPDEDYYRIRLA
jgi:hypothetical protein